MYRKNKVSEILTIDFNWEALARRASCSIFAHFLDPAISIIILIMTGFRAKRSGPKSGQGKPADLDALAQPFTHKYLYP